MWCVCVCGGGGGGGGAGTALLQSTNFSLGPDDTLDSEIRKYSGRIMAPN